MPQRYDPQIRTCCAPPASRAADPSRGAPHLAAIGVGFARTAGIAALLHAAEAKRVRAFRIMGRRRRCNIGRCGCTPDCGVGSAVWRRRSRESARRRAPRAPRGRPRVAAGRRPATDQGGRTTHRPSAAPRPKLNARPHARSLTSPDGGVAEADHVAHHIALERGRDENRRPTRRGARRAHASPTTDSRSSSRRLTPWTTFVSTH
jgi:hypothetical protein